MADKQQLQVSGEQLSNWRDNAMSAAVPANVSSSEVDWLLQEIAGLDSLALRIGSFKEKSQIQLKLPLEELSKLWQQRLSESLPVQYIAKTTPWRHFNIKVSPSVLIPRPETEFLIDLATRATADNSTMQQGNWADLGTGSGIIALGLASAFSKAKIHAVDRSSEALSIAQLNADNYDLGDRIEFYQGSWWEPLDFLKGELILCSVIGRIDPLIRVTPPDRKECTMFAYMRSLAAAVALAAVSAPSASAQASLELDVDFDFPALVLLRCAERVDRTFPGWTRRAFGPDGAYRPYDLNLPLFLPRRRCPCRCFSSRFAVL